MSELEPTVDDLTPANRAIFEIRYAREKRFMPAMVFLSILFPIQLLFFKKVDFWFLFWFTAGGLTVWWIVEWFLTPGRVHAYNRQQKALILNELIASQQN